MRIASALVLLKLSATHLPVHGFTVFAQLMAFAALLNLIAVGGTQNGVIREAAAADDGAALGAVHGAALAIWAAAVPVIGLAVLAGGRAIADLLIDAPDRWGLVAALAGLALAAGPGQIWCSILSGRGRATASLAAQAAGLLIGTSAAAMLIARHQAGIAALAFAAGPLLTMALAFAFARPLHLALASARVIRAEAKRLLGYSASIAATTGFSAIMLFGLRSVYRDHFGVTTLGYWMAANRISDLSTQFLGLFLLQFFVPHVATLGEGAPRRRLFVRCAAAGMAVMGGALLVFSLAAPLLVHLFLADTYLPAIPVIRAYMIGDTIRVLVSLAMFSAFARGRPGRYAAIEIATLAVMAAITFALIGMGDPRAPQFGYAGAYALSGLIAALVFLVRRQPATAASIAATA
ncbi:MAG: hypothetical protein ACTHJR_11740 [Sphingomonas sp.]